METRTLTGAKAQTQSLIARLADRFGVNADKLLRCLTTQVFKQADGATPSNEELMVLLLVCENFGLNPFSREIFAFRGKGGDIVPVVSLDGWCKIVRSQKDFNGMRFTFSDTTVRVAGYPAELPEYVECSMQLKGLDTPIVIQEYMQECFNDKSPVWKKWPRRMLRSRAFIQCARLAFSLTGIYDEGDAMGDDIVDSQAAGQTAADQPTKLSVDRAKLETLMEKLVTFAQTQPDGWQRAKAWIDTKLDGEDHSWAEAVLRQQYRQLVLAKPQVEAVPQQVEVQEPEAVQQEEAPHANA